MPAVARTCPLCKRKDIKYLSAHLKNKHKLVDAKERAPLLKRSLERSDVKRKDMVLAENESANDVFYEQERVLGASFKEIEDQIVELRLQALQTEYSAISEQCFRLEIRAKLLPLYGMIMKSLETLLLPVTTQTKREDATPSKHSEEASSQTDETPPIRKRKKKTSRRSLGGLDHLKNGLVRCRLCKFSWDGNAQHDCPYNEDGELLGTL